MVQLHSQITGKFPEEFVRNNEEATRLVLAASRAHSVPYDVALSGYQIHLGETSGPDRSRPYAMIENQADGAMSADGRIAGTYLHRIFDNDAFRARLLADFGVTAGVHDYRAEVDDALDAVAAELETALEPRWLDALL